MDKRTLERLSQPIVDAYTEVEMNLLIAIASKLKDNKDVLENNPAEWQTLMMQQLGMLSDEAVEIIQDRSGLTNEQMNNIMLNTGLEGVEENEEEMKYLKEQGAPLFIPPPVNESPQILAILEAYQRQARTRLNLTNQTLLEGTRQAYIDILNVTVTDVASGFRTGDQALRSVIGKWTEKGLPALRRRDGKVLSAEGYVRSVIVSTHNNIVNEMQDVRMEQWGMRLVEISSHAGNRPGCRPYAGRVFSLDEGHPKYPYLYDSSIGRIGDPDSLFGVNCGHVKYPFVEGISRRTYKRPNESKDQQTYEQSQKQREYERRIRKAKTREKVLRAAGDDEGANKAKTLINQRQTQMRKFIKESGRTRRYDREQIHS